MSYNNLNDEGYLVVDALSREESHTLSNELAEYLFSILFPKDTPRLLNLLTDQKLRSKIFGYNGNDLVWERGNTRTPYYTKSTGMFDGHYNLMKLQMIDFNPKLYDIATQVMGTKKLVFRAGLERYSIKPGIDVVDDIKAEGGTDMPLHLDANLFHPEVNYSFRIQSLISLSSDSKIEARDSGSLRLLVNFHHYWDFIGKLLHPDTGLYSIDDNKSRFHILPKDFEKGIVPVINEHIIAYTHFVHRREKFDKVYEDDSLITSFYEDLMIEVPKKPKLLEWRVIQLKPGQMVFWSQYLPHQSLRNKSPVPRIVAYYSLFPIDKGYYGSDEHKWLKEMISDCKFYYGVDAGKIDRTIRNRQEYIYLRKRNEIKKIVEYINNDPIARLLLGLDEY